MAMSRQTSLLVLRRLRSRTKNQFGTFLNSPSLACAQHSLSWPGCQPQYGLLQPEPRKAIYMSSRGLQTTKINTPKFESLFTPEVRKLFEIFDKNGQELRIAGRAVRELLLGRRPGDVDFATTATPNEMKAMFEKEGVFIIPTKSEAFGTITCRINELDDFEVTSLRLDVKMDSEEPVVEYTRDWEQDALRRDLTFNAMFLGQDGTLYDYFNGKEDLKNKKVRFVGNSAKRIQQDHLRILRYFRFHGRIGTNPEDHDAQTLKDIKDNVEGLQDVRGERVWIELKRLFNGRHVGQLMKTMVDLGIAPYIGLPEKPNIDEFLTVYNRCQDLEPLPMTLVPALLNEEEEVLKFHERVKMSHDELQQGRFIINHRITDSTSKPIKYWQDLLFDLSVSKQQGRPKDKIIELLKYLNEREILKEFETWQMPKFPVSAINLLEAGVEKGPLLAATLEALRQRWKDSRYTSTQDELLGCLAELDIKDEDCEEILSLKKE